MSQPTEFEGNVRVKTSVAPSVYGDGSLQVDSNLLVKGSQSSHQVTNFLTSDNIIGINEIPPGSGRDTGFLSSRYITDITSGTSTESGTAQGGTLNTITLDATADPTVGFYNKWVINITSGPGVGQNNVIIGYSGGTQIATIQTPWGVTPTNASTYDLFNNPRVGVIWDESQAEMGVVQTVQDHTSITVDVSKYCDLHVNKIIQAFAEECIYYVGMHGDDTNTGFHIMEAKKTFGGALSAALAEVPDAANQVAIVCFDGCEYTENISIPSWVHVRAHSAHLMGTITIVDNASAYFRAQTAAIGTAVTSSGHTTVTVEELTLLGSANGVANTGVSSEIKFKSDTITSGSGVVISDTSSGKIQIDVGHIVMSNGLGVAVNGGNIDGEIKQISGLGTAIVCNNTINLTSNSITTPTAFNIGGSGVLNLYTNFISGTQNMVAGAVSNVLPSGLLSNKGDLYTREISGTENKIVRFGVGPDNYVLTADSSLTTGLKWSSVGGGGPGALSLSYTLIEFQAIPFAFPGAIGGSWETFSYFPWLNSRYSGLTNGTVVLRVIIANRGMNLRVVDTTNNVVLGAISIVTTMSTSFPIINPTTDATVSFQMQKTASGGTNPTILGCVLEYKL